MIVNTTFLQASRMIESWKQHINMASAQTMHTVGHWEYYNKIHKI